MQRRLQIDRKGEAAAPCRRLQPVPRLACASSPLTPELKEFIDRAIVPALVRDYLATAAGKIDLAPYEPGAAHSDSSTVPKLIGAVRP
jgi:hypothetical protein